MDLRTEVYAKIEKHYREYAKTTISKFTRSMGKHDAEDVVQEAYCRACKYWRSYKTDMDFNAWLGTILTNCIRDNKQENARKGTLQEDLAPLIEPQRFDMTDHLFMNEVKKVISKQPIELRYVLNLYLFDGYTGKEIAQVTSFTPEAIRKMVSRFKDTNFERAGA